MRLADERWGLKPLNSNGLKVVDLFCGAGVGAVGFLLAGYDIVYAFDNNPHAVETYNLNIGPHAVVADARKISANDFPQADVYVGGFPCTSYSVGGAGKGQTDKKTGDLASHFFRLINEGRPRAFVMENVGGLITQKHKAYFDALMKDFEDIGYEISWAYINCHEHGVPQLRQRVFAVGIQKQEGKRFEFPAPIPVQNRTTLKDAIYDLPSPESLQSIPHVLHPIKNQDVYYDGGVSSRFTSRNRQKQWHEPSYTIVSQARQLPIYPEPAYFDVRYREEPMPRKFTVRECLRLQTVPDSFYFPSHIPLLKQYERCSGIPSLIAYQFGQRLATILNG